MKILSIQKNKILFDNEISFSISKNIINEYNLKEGGEITEEVYLYLLESSALSFSYWLLEKKDYPIKEFKDKLMIKYRNINIITEIIESLKEKNYLNDYDFTTSYVNSHKKWGRKKLEYNLFLKGINKEILKNILDENTDSEINEITRLWKTIKNKNEHKKIESLLRKGFQYKDIKKAISNMED